MRITDTPPELDTSPELGSSDIPLYQEMIGMFQWATELGRVDILHEISKYQASPREGHMLQLLRIFEHLEKHYKLSIYMDPRRSILDGIKFQCDTSEFLEYYQDAEEPLPKRFPKSGDKPVVTSAYVNASHCANKVTGRSHSGYICLLIGHQ